MIKNNVSRSNAKKLLSMFIDDGAKKLGIPVILDVNELHGNFILFARTPDMIEEADDNIIEVEYLKKAILAVLESNQKIVLAYEAPSDSTLKKALNDPKMLRFLRNSDIFPETFKKEFDVFIEIEEKYKDRFEIEPIGLFENDTKNSDREAFVKQALDLYERYKGTTTVLFYVDDDMNIHKTYIYERDKDTPVVLFYINAISVSDILDKIKKDIENEKIYKEEIAEICVFVPPKN